MAESKALWELLRQAADPAVADVLEAAVETGPDRTLCRINPLAFAAERQLGEEPVISTLVHAARIGLFDMAWNVLCPGCGGVLETGAALKTLNRTEYACRLCAADYSPTLDELVEVTFTVNPKIRRIGAHDPDTLSLPEYMRQIFWGSGIEFPDDLDGAMDKVTIDAVDLAPGEKAAMSLTMPAEFGIVFDPVTHTAVFLDVGGEPTTERRSLSVVLSEATAHSATHHLRPGPVRIAVENKSGRRTIPGVWLHNAEMSALMNRRRPFLTATRVLSNQTFRDLYRNATLDPEQRFKITNLTILFTDLRGSTALYDRVGDLAAFDLVRHHFSALLSAVAAEGGAVVKTIGDAVMATFPTPDRAVRAAMRMREEMRQINEKRGSQDLALNIGLHEGPCLAVTLNDRQDYFGQTVNIASRVQGLADPTAILATQPIVESAEVARLVGEAGYRTSSRQLSLRGVSEAFTIYEIRERERATAAA
jgi:class 3 adenylate cyclase